MPPADFYGDDTSGSITTANGSITSASFTPYTISTSAADDGGAQWNSGWVWTGTGGLCQLIIPSPEELARWEAEKKAEKIARTAAQEKAEALLREVLGEERFREYKSTSAIRVDSPGKPGRQYVVDAHNRIKVYEQGKLVDTLCLHLVESSLLGVWHDSQWLPPADVVLAKVWLLENAEGRVLAVANH